MKTAIVLKPRAIEAFALFARMPDDVAVITARDMLAKGAYFQIATTPPMADAESVFDAINLSEASDYPMNPGDVIVWDNGQRELCLSMGWAAV